MFILSLWECHKLAHIELQTENYKVWNQIQWPRPIRGSTRFSQLGHAICAELLRHRTFWLHKCVTLPSFRTLPPFRMLCAIWSVGHNTSAICYPDGAPRVNMGNRLQNGYLHKAAENSTPVYVKIDLNCLEATKQNSLEIMWKILHYYSIQCWLCDMPRPCLIREHLLPILHLLGKSRKFSRSTRATQA